MPQNQIAPFATGDGANTLTTAAYLAAGFLAQGFQPGVASSTNTNTVLRQISTVAAGLAQFIADNQAADVLDDGVPVNFENKLTAALKAFVAANAPAAPAQTAYGATANGGLAKDGSNNLLLALLNLVADNRATPTANDILALERNADGASVSVTARALANYVASQFQQAATFTRLTSTNLVGLSLAQTGDYAIPRGVTTTVPLSNVTVPPSFGSVSNGVLTVAQSGYYIIVFAGAMFMLSSTAHSGDFATFKFNLNGATGGLLSQAVPIPPNGGQPSANFTTSIIGYFQAGQQISLSAYGTNSYGDASSVGVSGYTYMLVALLNS